jgi:transcriptional regulator with XRE-family HTH domain
MAAPNLAFRDARTRAHLSQEDLARRIREAGFQSGDPNGCTRAMVQRWESGRTRRPQGRYLLALESVLGQPATTLGFEFADTGYGMDRGQALADAGLDAVLPLPEPSASYGPLTGIWHSSYEYFSSGREQTLTGRHHVMLLQRGARLMVRSLPGSAGSALSMDMTSNGQVITGTWTEQTAASGYYRGAVYHGAIQMLLEPTGRRMSGKWVGFGRELEVNSGPWALTMLDDHADATAIERWNTPPR